MQMYLFQKTNDLHMQKQNRKSADCAVHVTTQLT